jgi:hypothetical protein
MKTRFVFQRYRHGETPLYEPFPVPIDRIYSLRKQGETNETERATDFWLLSVRGGESDVVVSLPTGTNINIGRRA